LPDLPLLGCKILKPIHQPELEGFGEGMRDTFCLPLPEVFIRAASFQFSVVKGEGEIPNPSSPDLSHQRREVQIKEMNT
jgi:hypothetical protein